VGGPAQAERRWQAAQAAEREFWSDMQDDPATVAAIVASLTRAAEWARGRVRVQPSEEWVEIGIGPLGLGVGHFLREGPVLPAIVGVDPLALDTRAASDLPDPLAAVIRSCRDAYEHVAARGEATGLESGRFGAAFLNNMLDHVADPAAVLRETHRLLRSGGHLVLTCDVFSAAGRLKHDQWTRRRRPQSILVRAHPHRFSHEEVLALLDRAGFVVLASSYEGGRRRGLVGRGQDVHVHAVAR
jgi:SAM-dependent methyltransferase